MEDGEELQVFLKENRIEKRVMYSPINKQNAYSVSGEYTVSNLVGDKGLWLPSARQLTNNEIDYVCKKIREFFTK